MKIWLAEESRMPAVVLRISEALPYRKDASTPQNLLEGAVWVMGLCKQKWVRISHVSSRCARLRIGNISSVFARVRTAKCQLSVCEPFRVRGFKVQRNEMVLELWGDRVPTDKLLGPILRGYGVNKNFETGGRLSSPQHSINRIKRIRIISNTNGLLRNSNTRGNCHGIIVLKTYDGCRYKGERNLTRKAYHWNLRRHHTLRTNP